MEEGFFVKYLVISILMIVSGIVIRIYFKKTGLDDLNKVLGVNVYWLKLIANAFIIFGSLGLISLLVTFYYYLKNEGYI